MQHGSIPTTYKGGLMTVFKDTQQIYAVLEELWNYVIRETECGQKMKEYDVSYKFVLKEPNGLLYVDHEKVIVGDEANRDAVITMELSGDTVHKFWLKQIMLPVALATRKIKSKGPIPKVLKMLPYLKPVYENYPRFCEKHGIEIVEG
jgi:putative sterol carrier protein